MRKNTFGFGKVLAALFAFVSISVFAGNAKEFQDGDVVCFLGDSITHGGRYPFCILECYATRYPDRKLIFHNCGISGDTATGALKRLDWDLLDRKPNKTAIMLGMNDVGRSLYGNDKPNAQRLKMRKDRIEAYKASMEKLAEILKKNNIEIIYITPSPYDQTAEIEKKNLFGVNDALGECAEFCRVEAEKNKAGLVDFHKPMTELNLKHQGNDPKYTLIGKDRVHPGGLGHFVMAYFFLKDQGVPGIVSSVSLDYKDARLLAEKNCKVSKLVKKGNAISFDCLERSLPIPVSQYYQEADKLVPLTKDLNNEMIVVADLPNGSYELSIDGKKILKADAKNWGEGVNIATLPTPMQEQAAKVHELVMEKYKVERVLRGLSKLEIRMRSDKVDIGDCEARKKFFKEFLKKIEGRNYCAYYNKLIESYKKDKPQENTFKDKIKKLNADIYKEAAPRLHHYELKAL
jgi:endoglucanase